MNANKAAVLFAILCVLLVLGLIGRHFTAVKEKERDAMVISEQEQVIATANSDLEEQTRVNATLRAELTTQATQLQALSNRIDQVTAERDTAKVQAEEAGAEAIAAKNTIAVRDEEISSLTNQRDTLTRQLVEMNTNIRQLERQIAEAEEKLASSQGDRAFLLSELKRMQAEKTELERRFVDMAALRDQIQYLKDELAISQRVDWIRKGVYGSAMQLKGAELLKRGFSQPIARTNYNLNVELHQEGAVKIVPPTQ